MPDIGETIRTRLAADSAVTAITSRIYSDFLPQNTDLPAIVYFVVDTIPQQHLTGIVDSAKARIQIDCFAGTRTQANSLADAVRLSLTGFRGDISGQWVGEISLAGGEQHRVNRAEGLTDFLTSQDFSVHYLTTTS